MKKLNLFDDRTDFREEATYHGAKTQSDVDAWQAAYIAGSTGLVRMKVPGTRHYHLLEKLAPTAKRRNHTNPRKSLCGKSASELASEHERQTNHDVKHAQWVPVVGEDDRCLECQRIASLGRYFIQPFRKGTR